MECDPSLETTTDSSYPISTHVECDPSTIIGYKNIRKFQLTHSRGVRPPIWADAPDANRFQLTHSRGVRLLGLVDDAAPLSISTHALTWSATCLARSAATKKLKFQLTHSRGVRPDTNTHVASSARFQLTHSRGVRHSDGTTRRTQAGFQLTHSRGVRPRTILS